MDLYKDKLGNLAKVVSEIGTDLSPDGLALLGVCEIENRKVLEDFVKQELVADREYQIVHFDSPDKRGIDVGLLYQPKYFEIDTSESLSITDFIMDGGDTLFTRDILYVSGWLDGDLIHIYVNHWPSRSGGEKRSRPRRNYCANKVKKHMTKILEKDAEAKILVMGDLNDDPLSPSVKKYLGGKGSKEDLGHSDMFNPMVSMYKKGNGTLAWRDTWNLFDQMIFSPSWLNNEEGFSHYKTKIHKKRYLVQKIGRYKGYPFRTFDGDMYVGGYSDHYPVYTYLTKPVNPSP